MSPQKVREITREIQGLPADDAMDLLHLIPRKSARLVAQTLKSAIANAENNYNTISSNMKVLSAVVDEGPAFRRIRPVARGSAHPIRKRTSHISIELIEMDEDEDEENDLADEESEVQEATT